MIAKTKLFFTKIKKQITNNCQNTNSIRAKGDQKICAKKKTTKLIKNRTTFLFILIELVEINFQLLLLFCFII